MNKKAVIYGGGNIGRGFIGQLFYESGYETIFIDINQELINQINERKEYPVKFTEDDSEIIIKKVRGIDGSLENLNKIADTIANTDIMATSVGVNILKFIMRPIGAGINKRFAGGNFTPLDIILCENLIGADKVMRDGVREYIDDNFKDLYNKKIGFIEASVGRIVPIQTSEMKAGNPLRIVTEKHESLPVDKAAFKGDIPEIKSMIAYAPFEYFIRRKLFIYNMGHAVCAYLGDILGYEYIWQAIQDNAIEMLTVKIMQCSAFALSKIYSVDISDLHEYIDDLIRRFANKALGDTVKRVGNDLKRKLSPNDRIIGAYQICAENDVTVKYMCFSIAAAVHFKGDTLSGRALEDILKEAGSFDLLAKNPAHFALIKKYDGIIKDKRKNIKDLYTDVMNDDI